ncbi:MAG: hypothetical protein AAGA93_23830 [Actinomycetota bacterium]
MPKWLFWLALFFVLFLIYTAPGQAGTFASGFAEFAVELLNAIGEFLTGLFEGASSGETSSRNGFDSNPLSGDTGSSADPSFTHDHGTGEHTHNG